MKKEKMNNKGFSLVELIIVIAIMAVLVVVLAPQYLKYVEKSRNSTDISNATSAVTACQVYAADPDATTPFPANKTFTITVDKTKAVVDGDAKASAGDALSEAAINVNEWKCKSKTSWDSFVIQGTIEADGSISFDYSSSTDGTANSAFKDAMNK